MRGGAVAAPAGKPNGCRRSGPRAAAAPGYAEQGSDIRWLKNSGEGAGLRHGYAEQGSGIRWRKNRGEGAGLCRGWRGGVMGIWAHPASCSSMV